MEIYKFLRCYKCGKPVNSEIDLCIDCMKQETKENYEYIARLKSQKPKIVKLKND